MADAQPWTERERAFVAQAASYLEEPRFLARVVDVVGRPAEALADRLPRVAQRVIEGSVRRALSLGLAWVVRTLPDDGAPSDVDLAAANGASWWSGVRHTVVSAGTGGLGGALGFAAVPLELPVSTVLMLRSIAAVAREFGFDTRDRDVRLECLGTFSLGGPSRTDDAMDSAYYTTRLGLALAVREASAFVAEATAREVAELLRRGGGPALIRFVAQVAARYQALVAQKAAAQLVPLVGAVGGALVNAAFTDHFTTVARYHFGLRHLERTHGLEPVQALYDAARPRLLPPPAGRR